MTPVVMGALLALAFAIVIGVSSGLFRTNSAERGPVILSNFAIDFAVLFLMDWLAFHFARPMTTVIGLWWLLTINLVVAAIVASVVDYVVKTEGIGNKAKVWRKRDFSPFDLIAWVLVVFMLVFGFSEHNSGHSVDKVKKIVAISTLGAATLPPSSTSNMVTVPPEIATAKASQAMSTGVAGKKNYSTDLELAKPTLEYVNGGMWYVFQLQFDGAINKGHLGGIVPGYIMVSGEDPAKSAVEHYDGMYGMKVSIGGGQGLEPERWAYTHGYSSYLLDDATLELSDDGTPYFTVTLLRPRVGWTFEAPVGMLVINAHTGAITKYALNDAPSWVDRVYSQDMAARIANWWCFYAQSDFSSRGNSNRFKLSGDPILVYTGDGHPDWRMLATSWNKDAAVSYIILMDSHSGAMQIYQPQQAMGTEATLTADNGAFTKPSGQGASASIYSNHYQISAPTLHVIYGHLTWMVTYGTGGSNSTFAGIGFVDAYHASANNVVFGATKATALSNYLTQLAAEGTSNGNPPSQGGQTTVVTGKVAAVNWDVSGGQKFWYVTLAGDTAHVYFGTVNALGPALLMVQPGDDVTIKILNTGTQESSQSMQSFTDSRVPLKAPGS